MSEPTQEHERRLHEVLGAYFEAVEAGQAPSPQDLIAEHPDLAEELATFFASDERFHLLVAPLKSTVAAPEGETVDYVHNPHPTGASPDAADPGNGPAPALARGTRVRYLGDYELQRVLGEGGMGVVYRAKQLSLNRLVAVKMIRAGLWAGDEEVRRFKNEAEAVAGLDHPQIVPIYEIGTHDGQHYFSMKLVGDTSLASQLSRFVVDPKAAARLVAEVARAVHHAHQRGILHRDLKPSNILLDAEDRPHVTDFGLAKKLEGDGELSVSGSILGTPAYMSPEQATGRRGAITTATDVYGLGAILYAALTGRPPFQAEDVLETLEQVRGRAPDRPSVLNRRVGRDLETMCLKCLEKDPKRRYDSAAALADDLERYLRGEPILARRAGTWERVVKWSRRHPAAASLVGMSGIAALTLVGLGVGLVYHARLQEAYAKELTFLYQNRVVFAERELNDNNPHRAEQFLDECPEDRRQWEWHYLKQQCHADLLTIPAHRGRVWSVAVSSDGRWVATGGDDKAVRLWEVGTGRPVRVLRGHVQAVWSVSFSPDGTLIASVGGNRIQPDSVLIREAATGRTVLNLQLGTGLISSVAFSPDGRKLVIASGETPKDGWLKVCDARTGEVLSTIPVESEPAYYASFSPDGKSLIAVIGSNNVNGTSGRLNDVRVWDAATRRVRFVLSGHSKPVMIASYSPDGRTIATCSYDATVKLWNAADGQERLTLRGHQSCVNQAVFSPDNRRIATASDDSSAKIWDAAKGQELLSVRGHKGSVQALMFSPDGRRLVTAGVDGDVKVWDAASGTEARTLTGPPSRMSAVAFDPTGRQLVSGGLDGTLRVWDPQSGRLIAALPGHTKPVWGVTFSPDGTRIASAAGDWEDNNQVLAEVRIWDAKAGRTIYALRAHKAIAWSVAFSPDGRRLVSGGGALDTPDQEVIVWDVATGKVRRSFPSLKAGVVCVAFSPDGQRIAAVVGERIRAWDAETGENPVTFAGHTAWALGIAFSPDGRSIVSCSTAGDLRIWDAMTGRLLRTLIADKNAVYTVAFSPNGRRIASGGYDQTVKLWDAVTGQQLITLRGHPGWVKSVAFSPDGRLIASADENGLIKVWDGTPGGGGAR